MMQLGCDGGELIPRSHETRRVIKVHVVFVGSGIFHVRFGVYVLARVETSRSIIQVWRPCQASEGYRPSSTFSAFLRSITC